MSDPELRLDDYTQGYLFLIRCGGCGFCTSRDPALIVAQHAQACFWRLGELEARLICLKCGAKKAMITPMLKRDKHHFIAGMP